MLKLTTPVLGKTRHVLAVGATRGRRDGEDAFDRCFSLAGTATKGRITLERNLLSASRSIFLNNCILQVVILMVNISVSLLLGPFFLVCITEERVVEHTNRVTSRLEQL